MAATMASFGLARSAKLNKVIGALTQLQVSPCTDRPTHRCMSLGPPYSQEESRKLSQLLPLIPNLFNRLSLQGSQNGFSPHRTFLWKSFFGGPSDDKPPENVKPKAPANVFVMYLMKIQGQILRENPGISRTEMTKKAAEMWKKVHPDEKARIYADRREKFLKYKEAEKIYRQNITPEQIREEQTKRRKKEEAELKKVRLSLDMPKRPRTGFAEFVMERTQEKGEASKDHFKKAIQEWNTLDERTKKRYQEVSRKNVEVYEKNMKVWENNMIALGRYDVLRKKTLESLRQAKEKQEKQAKKLRDTTQAKPGRRKAKADVNI